MSDETKESRSGIIKVISTPIQLSALIVLVVEALLAFLLTKADAADISLYVMLMVGVLVLTIVSVFIIETKRLSLREANILPVTGAAQDSQKTYKWDAFLAAPMAALTDEAFEKDLAKIKEIKFVLETQCKFKTVFFAGTNMKTKADFDSADVSIETDLNALIESQNFIMVYPDKIVSSVLVEAGIALALGKPSFYFGKTDNFPFLLQQANNRFNHVKIYKGDTFDEIQRIITKNTTELFIIKKNGF